MSTGSWIFMLVTWAAILALVSFCYYKVLTKDRGKDAP